MDLCHSVAIMLIKPREVDELKRTRSKKHAFNGSCQWNAVQLETTYAENASYSMFIVMKVNNLYLLKILQD
jgi:glycerol-3-phosphate dehydrogenase